VDEAKLAQILRNLISNALKFTTEGEVRVACRVDAVRSVAVFSVTDTGVGIAPEHLGSIFDEFIQIENPLQSAARGAGLGLAVCQRLTAVLGGRLEVKSELDAGSAFTLEIPLVYAEPSDAGVDGTGTSMRSDDGDAAGRSALIIDDDEVARYLTGRTLRDCGYDVAEAPDGMTGLEAARERRPTLIVLDLKMPELDGFIVLQELKMDFRTADIPVVIQTAKAVTAQERGLLSAAVAIVDKREASRGTLATVIETLEDGV
jgi:CheY-like chemotaxis protein